MRHKISTYSGEVKSCILDALTIHRDSNILVLDDSIAAGRFFCEHIVVLFAVDIEWISHHFDQYPVLEVQHVESSVVDSDLGSAA